MHPGRIRTFETSIVVFTREHFTCPKGWSDFWKYISFKWDKNISQYLCHRWARAIAWCWRWCLYRASVVNCFNSLNPWKFYALKLDNVNIVICFSKHLSSFMQLIFLQHHIYVAHLLVPTHVDSWVMTKLPVTQTLAPVFSPSNQDLSDCRLTRFLLQGGL